MCGKGKSGKSGKSGKAGRKLQSDCIQDSGLFLEANQSNSSDTKSSDDQDDDDNTHSNEGEHDDDDEVSPSNEENTTMTTLGNNDEVFDDGAVGGFVVLGLDNTISDPLPLGSPQNTTAGELEEISNDEISNDVRD
jgi:hypothetical protein